MTSTILLRPLYMSTAKHDVLQGTLALIVLKTLASMGKLHGYGLARRIEQVSGDLLEINQGTLYPALLRLEEAGSIASEWGVSEANRKARYYSITEAGLARLLKATQNWGRTTEIMARFLDMKEGPA